MSLYLENHELLQIIKDSRRLGRIETLVDLGKTPEFISQNEAYRLFGEGVVKRWIQEGLIKRKKDGNNTSKIRLSRIELQDLAITNNRLTYLDSEERKQK